MNLIIRASCATQLWLLRYPNFLTRFLLTVFYSVEVIVYSAKGARTFLLKRTELCGRNYASLGRLIVGDYGKVAEILANPQRRGAFLGRGRLVAKRLPKDFLLALSDEGAGGDGTHRSLHDYIWNTVAVPAQERLSDPDLASYIDELVREAKSKSSPLGAKEIKPAVERMVIRYMMRSLFGLTVTDAQIEALSALFLTGGPRSSFILSALKPMAPPGFLLGGLRRNVAEMTRLIEGAPALRDYAPSDENANLTKEEYCSLLLPVVGIAAFGGGGNLANYVLTDLPADYPIDLDDDEAVKLAVLETARRHPPVNNINIITHQSEEFEIGGRTYTLPAGTVIAASICLGCLDPKEFPDPDAFKPDRDNLVSSMLNFNAVGYHANGDTGLRTCPGRNIAVRMCSDLLIAWRKATS